MRWGGLSGNVTICIFDPNHSRWQCSVVSFVSHITSERKGWRLKRTECVTGWAALGNCHHHHHQQYWTLLGFWSSHIRYSVLTSGTGRNCQHGVCVSVPLHLTLILNILSLLSQWSHFFCGRLELYFFLIQVQEIEIISEIISDNVILYQVVDYQYK